jgi:hypothetical protein
VRNRAEAGPTSERPLDVLQLTHREPYTDKNKATYGCNRARGNNFDANCTLGKDHARCHKDESGCRGYRAQNQQKQRHNANSRPSRCPELPYTHFILAVVKTRRKD